MGGCAFASKALVLAVQNDLIPRQRVKWVRPWNWGRVHIL